MAVGAIDRATEVFVPVVERCGVADIPAGTASSAFDPAPVPPAKAERHTDPPAPRLTVEMPNGVTLRLECSGQDVELVSAMIVTLGRCDVPAGRDLQVYLHREAIDFRIGINGLAILVEQAMHLDPFRRAVFAFCNRRRDRIRLLFYDRSGFWLMMKRAQRLIGLPGRVGWQQVPGGEAIDRTVALVARGHRHRGGAAASGAAVLSVG